MERPLLKVHLDASDEVNELVKDPKVYGALVTQALMFLAEELKKMKYNNLKSFCFADEDFLVQFIV